MNADQPATERSIHVLQYCPRCGWGMYLSPSIAWVCGNFDCRYLERLSEGK